MAQYLRLPIDLRTLKGVILIVAAFSSSAFAEPLDTVIAPQIGAIYIDESRKSSANSTTSVEGYRYTFRVDFMSLSDNLSLNLVAGIGGRYNDYGGQLRLFDLLQMGTGSASGLYYGVGVGYSYSPGYVIKEIPEKTAFYDAVVTAFLRFQWDTESNWGIFTEFAYENVIQRSLAVQPTVYDKGSTNRYVFNMGIPFEVDL